MRSLQIGAWTFHQESNRLEKGEHVCRLEKRTAEVLARLASQPGEVFSKDDLIGNIWKGASVSAHSVSVAISDLRKAFEDDARHPNYIETVPKRGYRLIAPVHDEPIIPSHNSPTTTSFYLRRLPPLSWIAITGVLLFAVLLTSTKGISNPQPITARSPIIMSDICTGAVQEDVQDMSYELAELITISLQHQSKQPLLRRRASEPRASAFIRAYQSHYRDDPPSLLIESALLDFESGLVLTIELLRSDRREVLWSRRFSVTSESMEDVAGQAAEEITEEIGRLSREAS